MTDRSTFRQLVDLATGALPEHEAAAVRRLATEQPAHAATLRWIEETIRAMQVDDSVDPPAALVERAKAIFQVAADSQAAPFWQRALDAVDAMIATLLFDSRAQPAVAGFRGVGDVVRLAYEVDGAEIELEIADDTHLGSSVARIMGQISGDASYAGSRVAVVDESNQVVATADVDEDDLFTLSVPPGTYRMVIEHGGSVMRIDDLTAGV